MIVANCACVAAGGRMLRCLAVEQDQADRVLLLDQQHGQRDDQRGGVVELRQRAGAVVHRGAGIDHERDPQVAFFFVLLDVMAIGAPEDAPVEPAQIVAGRVFAVLGELDVEAVERTAMLPADRPFDDTAGAQHQAGDARRGRQDRNTCATAIEFSAPVRTGTSRSSASTIESLVSPSACAA